MGKPSYVAGAYGFKRKKMKVGSARLKGSKNRHIRAIIFKRDDYTCQICGQVFPVDELTLDHIVPLCAGGTNKQENLQAACDDCNFKKGEK